MAGGLTIGRYTLAEPLAAGGMATIFLAVQGGGAGFSRVVAIKRLHQHYANEPDFISMFLDEARLAARIRHPNVVQILDVVHEGPETMIVLEYIDGETVSILARTLRDAGARVPPEIVSSIVVDTCRGLHAAHEARSVDGTPLGIVHRDVSPQNLIVGADGVTRVTDFGIALANERLSHTRAGEVKGKPAYMAPEQVASDAITRQSDLYAVGLILWELLSGRRAYEAANQGALLARVMKGAVPRLIEVAPWVTPAMAAVVDRALAVDPQHRFASGKEMAAAVQSAQASAPPAAVAAFLERAAHAALARRRAAVLALDRGATGLSRTTMRGEALPKEPAAPAPGAHPAGAAAAGPLAAHAPLRSQTPPPAPLEFLGADPSAPQPLPTQTLTDVRPGAARTPRWIAVAALLVIAASGLASAWILWSRGRKLPAASAALAAPASAPAPSERGAAPSPPASALVASATASATPSAALEPTATASAPASASASAVASTSASPPLRGAASARMPASSATVATTVSPPPNPCDPPYYVDDHGIRRVKRNCF